MHLRKLNFFYEEKHNSSIWTGSQNYAIFSMEQKEQIQHPAHSVSKHLFLIST